MSSEHHGAGSGEAVAPSECVDLSRVGQAPLHWGRSVADWLEHNPCVHNCHALSEGNLLPSPTDTDLVRETRIPPEPHILLSLTENSLHYNLWVPIHTARETITQSITVPVSIHWALSRCQALLEMLTWSNSVTLTEILWSEYYYLHFTDETTKAQRG